MGISCSPILQKMVNNTGKRSVLLVSCSPARSFKRSLYSTNPNGKVLKKQQETANRILSHTVQINISLVLRLLALLPFRQIYSQLHFVTIGNRWQLNYNLSIQERWYFCPFFILRKMLLKILYRRVLKQYHSLWVGLICNTFPYLQNFIHFEFLIWRNWYIHFINLCFKWGSSWRTEPISSI